VGGKSSTISQTEDRISAIRIQSSAYGKVIPIVWGRTRVSGNLMWYGDFQAIAHTTTTDSGGKGGGGVRQENTTFTYQASVAIGLCEGPIQAVGTIWSGKTQFTAADLGAEVFTGTYPQTPWGYLTTFHPGEDLSYHGVAYFAIGNYQLGSSAELPNHTVEVMGRLPFNVGGGIFESNPKDVVIDALTNVNYGAGFDPARIPSYTSYSNYCVANGLFLSPALTEQAPAQQFLKDLTDATNSAPVWSEGVLKIIPYGDQSATGNGATYTPNVTPIYDLTDDDYIPDKGSDPVTVSRKTSADAFNHVQVEFLNKNNQYNIEIAEAKDQANIGDFGLRSAQPIRYHSITDPATARFVAQFVLQRALYVRNTYKFKLGWKFCLLEPMDIVTLTESRLGLSFFQVRITEVEDDEEGRITITAEEFPFGVATPAVYSSQSGQGFNADYNFTPASVSAPVIFEPPSRITETGIEVWAAVTDTDTKYGGCEVWISSDNATFKRVARLPGRSRVGVTTSTLPLVADPDTVSTLGVNLTSSKGALLAGTQNDVDLFHTLCYVGGELISYRDATLTGTNLYNLNYLRRGAYGTTIASHASASSFIRLDDGVVKIPYTKEQIGHTIFLKFLAFNQWGGGIQGLADVSAYSYTIIGPTAPQNVTNFTARQVGNVVSFDWDRLTDPAVIGYDIAYGPLGTTLWSSMTPLTLSSMGTEMTNASVPPGDWTFGIRARNIADLLSPQVTTFNLTVVSNADVIRQVQQAPDWLGNRVPFFNGSSDIGSVPFNSVFNFERTGSFTLVWRGRISPTGNSGFPRFVGKSKNDSTLRGFWLYLNASNGAFGTVAANDHTGNNRIEVVTNPGAVVTDYPMTLGVTYSGNSNVSGLTLYRNGVAVTKNTVVNNLTGTIQSNDPLTVMARAAPTDFVAGECGEVFIYNRALSGPDMLDLHRGIVPTMFAGSCFHWDFFNAKTNGVVRDDVSGFDLTLTGTAPSRVTELGRFVHHPSGVLIPDSTQLASAMSDADLWDTFVASPQGVCNYDAPEFDIGFDDDVRAFGRIDSQLGPGVVTGIAAPVLQLDFRKAANAYDGFENWTVGFVNAEFYKFRARLDTSVGVAKLTGFLPTVDQEETTSVIKGLTIAAGGTTFTFAALVGTPYHNIPAVFGQIKATDGRTVSITNVTATGFTAHVFLSGSDVGGTIDVTIIGV
jgi:hypothetical protein